MILPTDAAERAIAADRAHDDPAIWITRLPDAAIRARAAALAAEGAQGRPLWGLTFAVKDNIDVAGLPTTAACPAYAYMPGRSAPVVEHLLDAGALLLGKTNLDQFATGLVGTRSPYGVPRNVLDASRVPGGSSSGSACAVAAGIADFALGTDTAGSGRVPAAFGGIVGLKPTIGSFSATGMVPACRSIDTISVFARTVAETLAVARVAAAYDDADPYSRSAPHDHLRQGTLPPALRIAAAAELPACTASVETAYRDAARALGATPVDIAPLLDIARLLYDGPWVAERTAALRDIVERHPDALHPVTRTILQAGYDRRTVDAFDAFHQLARTRRFAENLFAKYDALLLPTAPFCPTLAELDADPMAPNARLGTFTNFVNLCDLAAIAIPAGTDPADGPMGLTLIGPAWSEGRLATIADHLLGTSASTDADVNAPRPDETSLFCVGAHMAGLPLNRQLTTLGGRYLRDARTRPDYRLYALGPRPGLVAVDDNGASVAGEVWAVPTTAVGALLATVPPPLGFGTVALADGPCLGFLCEAAGASGADDITRFGGWRAWLAARDRPHLTGPEPLCQTPTNSTP